LCSISKIEIECCFVHHTVSDLVFTTCHRNILIVQSDHLLKAPIIKKKKKNHTLINLPPSI